MKIAVIENEFGAVSIDTALVEANVREVGNGVGMVSMVQPSKACEIGFRGAVIILRALGDWSVV